MSKAINYRLETIVVRNISLEIPENIVTPTFKQKPEVQIEMRNKNRALAGGEHYEVLLDIIARVKSGDELQILIEIQQAGIFYLQGADAEQQRLFLGIHAPTLLYPYLTQLIGDLMARAGAPRVFLPPFDFATVYDRQQALRRQRQQEAGGEQAANDSGQASEEKSDEKSDEKSAEKSEKASDNRSKVPS